MDMTGAATPVRWLATLTFLLSASLHSRGQQIHEHMTTDELRHVFHVEDASLVPEYHLVRLTHHLSRRHIPASHASNNLQASSSKTPHEKHYVVKKRLKFEPPSLLDDQMFTKLRNSKDVDIIGDLDTTVSIHFGDESIEKMPHVSETSDDIDGSNESISKPIQASDKPIETSETIEVKSEPSEKNESLSEIEDLSDREHISNEQDEDTHRIKLEAFGKEMELVLKKQEGLLKKDGLKMWNLTKNETQPHGVDFEQMETENEDLGELYQDEAAGAALLIRRHPAKDKLIVEGSIGHDLVIRPLPDSLSTPAAPVSASAPTATAPGGVPDDEMFLEAGSMADMVSIDTGLPILRHPTQQERLRRALAGAGHVLIRRRPAQGDHHSDYAFMEPDHLAKRYRRRRRSTDEGSHSRRKREAPYVIYPEILVIVDYDGYRLHGGDNVQIKRYFVSFWNGVDLRYKLLKGPRIRISIAGIIISRGRDATPYLERNRVGRDAIDSAAALTDMGKYLFRERRLPVYDIAVAITKLDMCRRQYANDACNRGTAGFAYVGGACVVNKRLEKVNSVAIIEDTGGFSGIIVAAHEVGHLLGAVHDGSPPPSYLGGPGAQKCQWEDGFIMSDLRHTEKGFRWSPCSVQSFHHFLNGDTATCLYNAPHEDDSLPRVLPGRLLTLDAQCRKDRGTSACFKDERVCAQLFCFDAGSGYCVAYRPAAEGSPCGDGQYCINGRCITEHENIIPDYSQHTPTYLRPETSPFYTNATSIEDTTQPYTPQTPSYQHYETTKQEYSYAPSTSTTANAFKYLFFVQSTTKSPYNFNYLTEKTTSYKQPSNSVTPHQYIYNKYSITSTKSPYDFQDFATRRTLKTTDKTTTTTSTTTPNSYELGFNPYEQIAYERESDSYENPSNPNETPANPSETPLNPNENPVNPYENPANPYENPPNPYESPAKPHQQPEISFDTNSNPDKPNPFEPARSFIQFDKNRAKPRSGFFSKQDLDGFFNRSTTKSPFPFKDNKVKSLYKIGTYYNQQRDNAIRPDANSQQAAIEPARMVHSFQSRMTNEDGSYSIDCSSQEAYYRPECQPQNAVATSK